ncbi:hypothetical protein OG884_20070 [Streptosporangium sp. NBC_01755]|uniref:hypothetical protein n=1 Tax=unclassified Streptosporangium TaxID=2632669 RepID=UPI002DD82ED5|nr:MULTISPECIES: hypothetical protein [unclassified Streptosporangium]WSA24720.1 hypothetical protein OIE13_27840 [Streptosporangium sp. NBC_01810]WSC97203.1 hypothetical protein OG884_20070 [Streptosporangium sp. NBC_01755]
MEAGVGVAGLLPSGGEVLRLEVRARLLDTPARGDYRTRIDDAVHGGSTIARAALADAVLRVLPDSGTHRHTVDVAY